MPKYQVDSGRLLDAFRKVIRNQPVMQSAIRIDPDVCFVQHYDTSLEPELVNFCGEICVSSSLSLVIPLE